MAILRVALVTPLTGPLARFGRAGSTALDVWARQAARLPAGWRGVKLEVHDAHPNPAQAMSASTASHPDVVFGPYGSSPAVAAAAALAFEVRAVGFPPGQAADAAAQLPDAEVLLVVGGFEDEIAAARVLLGRGWRAAAFVDAFRRAAGEEPGYPAVQAFAAGVLSARCLRDAGTTDDAAQLAAAAGLSCRTLYGGFRLDPVTGLQGGHQVLTVQWQGGSRRVVWPPELAERPLLYPLSRS